MSDVESNRVRRIVGWGLMGLIVVIGVSIVSFSFFRPAHYGTFFPFHFGWVGGIFLVFIVFWIARWFLWPWKSGRQYRYPHETAESILKERYARGDITRQQYEQMMGDLER